MEHIFVNLKRFDVPRKYGGVCPEEQPDVWIKKIMQEVVELGLGSRKELRVTFLLPEALIIPAIRKLNDFSPVDTQFIRIGCQGVFRENINPEGNFGAFTSNLPAIAARNLGCTWSMIGHSEERKDKLGLIRAYEPNLSQDRFLMERAIKTINNVINQEVLRALESGLNVLLCVGETAAERGSGDFPKQQVRIKEVLKEQLLIGLKGIEKYHESGEIVIAYEPIWAIGPGKTPPGKEYITFVSELIRDIVQRELNFEPNVVYGGGLKKENAAMFANINSLNGGLVALTKFTGQIGFEPGGLNDIVTEYLKQI